MTNAERIQANNAELQECITLAESLPDVEEVTLQSKTVTPGDSEQEVIADDGYTALEKVTVEPIPSEYIVPSGELEITENGTHDVTAYASVSVNVEGSGGGDELADLLTNTMTDLDSDVTSIRQYAFRGATKLISVNLPYATSIATNAFYGCTKLTSVNMPLVTSIKDNVFNNCYILPSIVLPSLTSGGGYMFRYCNMLTTIDLPVLSNIVANMFYDCRRLTAVILRKTDAICTLENTSAFTNCYHFHGTTNSTYNPDGLQDGYIYVHKTLDDGSDGVAVYQAATNWSTLQFRAIEDYPDITGG